MKGLTTYFTGKQLPPFGFADKYSAIRPLAESRKPSHPPPHPPGIFVDHFFLNLTMYQVTFRWSADFLSMDKVTRGHRSMVPFTLRVVLECAIKLGRNSSQVHMVTWLVVGFIGGYPKVLVRSFQGHSKVKSAQNG